MKLTPHVKPQESHRWDGRRDKVAGLSKRLRQQLAAFLRSRRGGLTLAQFARKTGLSDSTLQRLEIGEQNITLDTLEALMIRLKCSFRDIFKD